MLIVRFLLATLQVEHVSNVPAAFSERTLVELPRTLDSALDKILQRIKSKDPLIQELAFKTLAWVLYVTCPLTIREILEALSVDVWKERGLVPLTDQDIVGSCSGLVFIEAKNGTVRFLHHGVEEYLLQRLPPEGKEPFLPFPKHLWLAKICLTFASFMEFESGPIKDNNTAAFRLRHLKFPCRSQLALSSGGRGRNRRRYPGTPLRFVQMFTET